MAFVRLVLAGACLLYMIPHEQQQSREDRVVKSPQYFVKAGAFLDMKESDRALYASGLMDGFFASAFWGANEGTVGALTSCTQGMTDKQVSAIIAKYVQDRPETWHHPLSVEAFNAFRTSCPGGLRVASGE
jgi:hypothetical protein